MILYSYYRSSAAYRMRIALNLKGIPYEMVPISLVKDGGEHRKPEYAAINPQMRVPALKLDTGEVLVQSPAMLEWLEETHPEPALLPKGALERARVRAVAAIIACDVHPPNNSSPLARLRQQFGASDEQVNAWVAHWVHAGFPAVEALIAPGPYCFGATPTIADVCLVPQIFSARRFNVDLSAYPKILAVDAAMQALPAVQKAAPGAQPDAV